MYTPRPQVSPPAPGKLCFFDKDTSHRVPIQSLWKLRNLISSDVTDEDVIKASDSTAEEWKESGLSFFHRFRYKQAAFCFRKSQHSLLRLQSLAFHYVSRAKVCLYSI